jgi:selenocysteine lyase/cysteine desulfurase
LEAVKGVSVTTPRDRMAGLVCFTVAGMAPKAVSDAAYERGYTIRYVDQRPGPAIVRTSTGWWCSEEEIDGLRDAIAEIAASTGA